MNETPILGTKTFTGSASLAAVGIKLAELKLFEPICTYCANCSEDDQGSAK